MITFGYVLLNYPTPKGGRNRFLDWLKETTGWVKHKDCEKYFIQEYFDSWQIATVEELDTLYHAYLKLHPYHGRRIELKKFGYIRDIKMDSLPVYVQKKVKRLNSERAI